MKRLILIVLVVTVVLTVAASVQAAQPSRGRSANRSNRGGFFARMMELERRKNAALRSMFSR